MKSKKILKAVEKFLKKHWQKWTILAILAIVVYIGIVFYLYVYKPAFQPQESTPLKLEIDKETYQEVMEHYNQKQEIINQIMNKEYINPFK